MPRTAWTRDQRAHAGREILLGALISALFSIGFVFLIFGGARQIASRSLMWDAVPQSFMIVLMASLVPGLFARAKIASGVLRTGSGNSPSVKWIVTRALFFALITAALALACHALVLPIVAPQGAVFTHVLIFKLVYGAMLGAAAVALLFRRLFATQA